MKAQNPTVFVIKEQVVRGDLGPTPMDYTPAYKFGDVQFITDFDLPLHGKGTLTLAWHKAAHHFCQVYDDSRDFIICTGQPLAIFVIGHMLGRYHKQPRILVWRPQERVYQPIEFVAGELQEVLV